MALTLKHYSGFVHPTVDQRINEILNMLPNKGDADPSELERIREVLRRSGCILDDFSIDYGYIGDISINRKPGWHNEFIFGLTSSDFGANDDLVLSFFYFCMDNGEIDWTEISPDLPFNGMREYAYVVVEDNLQEYLSYREHINTMLDGDQDLTSVLSI